MSKLNRGVAIVPRIDTGVVKSSAGDELGADCEVLCDRSGLLYRCENASIVFEEMGAGHGRFDGGEVESDLAEICNRKYPHLHILVKYWEDGKKGQRIADFKFLNKPNEQSRPEDPFYIKIINGHAIVRLVGSTKISG